MTEKLKKLKEGEHTVTYVIPLAKAYDAPRKKRAKVAIRLIREFIERHLHTPEKIVIHNKLNEEIWSRSIEKPPRRVKVEVKFIVEEGKIVEAEVRPRGLVEESEES